MTKGEKVRNICQKVVQLAEKGEKNEKVKNGENKLTYFGLFIYEGCSKSNRNLCLIVKI